MMVDIVIPTYNASSFILNTLESVQKQTYLNYTIIVVDDCSTDDSLEKIKQHSLSDKITILQNTKNEGVSFSRNRGLLASKATYVLFLDADDILSPEFIEKRIQFLEQKSTYAACCSNVIKFNNNNDTLPGSFHGANQNCIEEILTYNPNIITCPSNYLFRREYLLQKKLKFNTELSSSADKFFLIEFAKVGNIGFVPDAPLHYRVNENSMSHKLTPQLLSDNEIFVQKVQDLNLGKPLTKTFRLKSFYSLGISYLKLKKIGRSTNYLFKSFIIHPLAFSKLLFKGIFN